MSTPISAKMKDVFGENQAVEYASVGGTGALGTICGQPFDTWLTHLQDGKSIGSYRHLMRGTAPNALSIAGFFMGYHYMQKVLNAEFGITKE